MTLYPMIQEKLQAISIVLDKKQQVINEEKICARPLETDLNKIPQYYLDFKTISNPENKYNTRIFVFIMFYMYTPSACVDKQKVKVGVRKTIAKLLRISGPTISQLFGDAKVLFAKHRRFRNETERIYSALLSK